MISKFFQRLFDLPRGQKRAIQLVVDTGLMLASFGLAMALRLESLAFVTDPRIWAAMLVVIPCSLLVFMRLGFYRAVIRFISAQTGVTILLGIAFSTILLALVSALTAAAIPRSVPVIYAMLALLSVGGVRFVLRAIYQQSQIVLKEPVIIYGGGEAGRQLLATLQQGREYNVVAFVDDDPHLQGVEIGGVRVHASRLIGWLTRQHGVKRVLLAIPSASRQQRKVILDRLESLPVRVQTIPGIADILSGKARITELREVALEELLGRDPVPPREELLDANIRGKVVLVSGAGGSIGSELCRQILRRAPKVLVLLEVSEFALYTIDMELRQLAAHVGLGVRIVPLLGSVQSTRRSEAALRGCAVETIYHAAAYKHVPMVEHNVVEGIRNNVFGTRTLALAAIAAGVRDFILISTDKAVRPTNVMGASKRLAELVCQALAARQSGTRFAMVRFGNVLGSSGSVIPLFRHQIETGGPITVTDPEITRYFMTIPEAAQLVIQAGAMARGGDVFVLDMGEPAKIVDLAQRMVRLCGLTPYIETAAGPPGEGDIAITFTGLRSGEKRFEELLTGNNPQPTSHPRIMTAQETCLDWPGLEDLLAALFEASIAQDVPAIRALLQAAPIGYQPAAEIADLLWNADDLNAGETAALMPSPGPVSLSRAERDELQP